MAANFPFASTGKHIPNPGESKGNCRENRKTPDVLNYESSVTWDHVIQTGCPDRMWRT